MADYISLEPGKPLWAVERFEKHAGGSQANVAVGLHHHGVPVRLWSKVGRDSHGVFLRHQLRAYGLSDAGVATDTRYPTKIALVGLDERGVPDFEMHNMRSAYDTIDLDDLPLGDLADCTLFHFGATTLLAARSAETTLALLAKVKAHGALVSFDPNLSLDHIPDPRPFRERFEQALRYVDLLKLQVDDWAALMGERTPADVLASGLSMLVLTRGALGATLQTPDERVDVKVTPVDAVDTTGAGDAFTAALLAEVVRRSPGVSWAAVSATDLQAWGRIAHGWSCRVLAVRGSIEAYAPR